MLWAQVLSRAVTECLSGSCSSREVMHRCTDCRKGLASAAERPAMSAVFSARTLARPTQPRDQGCQLRVPVESWNKMVWSLRDGLGALVLVLYMPALSLGGTVSHHRGSLWACHPDGSP